MTLTDIFNLLQYGELANVSISGGIDAAKGISSNDWPILITHINMAMTDMHTKLNLKEREVTVTQMEILSYYKLHSDHAESTPIVGDKIKYIEDSVEAPFLDDIIRINDIFNVEGKTYAINDESDEYSLYLPKHDIVQVPYPIEGQPLHIMYKATHPKIALDITDPDSIEIDIPEYCVEPLLAYVASRVHASRITPEAQALSVNLLGKYTLMLTELKTYNVFHNDPNNTNIKLGDRGWV